MKETGILFTPENHRAILNKAKWQTRRVINYQSTGKRPSIKNLPYWETTHGKRGVESFLCDPLSCPYGVPGDRLYVKEGIIVDDAFDPPELAGYYMDGVRATLPNQKRLTAMFMAKRYARTWLELTDVRIECLHDISEEDAKAEGSEWIGPEIMYPDEPLAEYPYRRGYQKLWDSINKVKHPWSKNDWVWVLEFRVI